MPRLLIALLVLISLAVVAGCESSTEPPAPVRAAPPQRAELGWSERAPAEGPGLVFRTNWFAVREGGWDADVEITNQTAIPWELGADTVAVAQSFGVMLFATDALVEVEGRSRNGDLPALRAARSFEPALPDRLAPGASWRGVISARGALAAGRYVRVVFGPLIAVGEPPKGVQPRFSWITDNAYLLAGSPNGA